MQALAEHGDRSDAEVGIAEQVGKAQAGRGTAEQGRDGRELGADLAVAARREGDPVVVGEDEGLEASAVLDVLELVGERGLSVLAAAKAAVGGRHLVLLADVT
ncbi:MAG: hypothetical protein ACFCGT_02990 [Sandaracinaceae bacterium]